MTSENGKETKENITQALKEEEQKDSGKKEDESQNESILFNEESIIKSSTPLEPSQEVSLQLADTQVVPLDSEVTQEVPLQFIEPNTCHCRTKLHVLDFANELSQSSISSLSDRTRYSEFTDSDFTDNGYDSDTY
jgi:DNA-directed RNA polymerase beta' subunit